MRIAYHIRNVKPDGRNEWCIAVVIDAENWTARAMKFRKLTSDNRVYSRPAVDVEKHIYGPGYRMLFYRYYNWHDLIDDENRLLPAEHELFKHIEKWKEKYKEIPAYGSQQTELIFPNQNNEDET